MRTIAVSQSTVARVLIWMIAATILALTVITAAPVHAVGNGQFSVEPWGDPSDEDFTESTRNYFVYSVHPGESIVDWVSIANDSDVPLQFTLYAADAHNLDADGAFTLRLIDDEMNDVGTWIQIDEPEVLVEPGTRVIVPFRLSVPLNATPGDHSGGIVALSQDLRASEGNASIAVQSAIGARIYASVAGDTKAELSVTGLDVLRSGDVDGAYDITYTVTNTGNLRMSPQTSIAITGLFGRKLADMPSANLRDLLPGESTTITEVWREPPAFDRTVVTVTAAQGTISSSASKTTWIVTPAAMVVIATILLALVALVVWRWRRRRVGDSTPPPGQVEELVDA
ncbi:MAG: hypothetical protein ACR2N2_01695 [Acidimicrobiia bacterium]